MARPHPRALRERVVTAYENGEGSYAELAERFGVGEASVDRWLALKRQSGDVAPRSMGGARHERKISEEGKAFIVGALTEVPDSSIAELVQAYEEEFGVRVGRETMRVTVVELGYTKKKPSGGRRHPSAPTWSRTDSGSARRRQK